MRTLRLGVALGLLFTAAACAGPNAGTSADPSDQISSTTLPAPTGPPPTLANATQPDRRAVDLRPVRWTRAEGEGGRRLDIHYATTGKGECNILGRVDVAETEQAVTVTVLLGRLPGTDCSGAQPQIAAPAVTVVTLPNSLGTRTVRDGAG